MALSDAEKSQHKLLYDAKGRAKKSGLPFNLRLSDVAIPALCPVCDRPLKCNRGKHGPDSPSVDRIIPAKGYTRGNVAVICYRCNVIKRDATPDELLYLARYTHSHTTRRLTSLGERGGGRVFRVRGSRYWHVGFYRHGEEFRISSRSENKTDAENLLRKWTGYTPPSCCNRCGTKGGLVTARLCLLCVDLL
jgi:hypothetical protein